MASDRAYTALLSHLSTYPPRLPLSTIQSALGHHLANTGGPTPTPLAAIAVTSTLYLTQPFTHDRLQSLLTAFRYAAHLKYRAVLTEIETRTAGQALLGLSAERIIGQWVGEVLEGIQGAHPTLRLASCSGLLLGVEDIRIGNKAEHKKGVDVGGVRSSLEDEAVVSLAEVMDTYAYGFGTSPSGVVEEWEKEFQPAGRDILSLALVIASQALPIVPDTKLKTLPLSVLAKLLHTTVSSAFKNGTFLLSLSASVTLTPTDQIAIPDTSPVALMLQSISASPINASIASISRFTATVLTLLLGAPPSRFEEAMSSISDIFGNLETMTKQIERDWISCSLSNCTEEGIAPESRETTKKLWATMKSLLFTIVMLTESVLSGVVFLPPQGSSVTPAILANKVLNSLSHLSFVISEFGGVVALSQGFEQLKKTFYLALDILAQGEWGNDDNGTKAEEYVRDVCFALNSMRKESAANRPLRAKQAFVLASLEQLIPVLSESCIKKWVWGVCYPHLFDVAHRETFESAHSVVLTIFSSHAQRLQVPAISNDGCSVGDVVTVLKGKKNLDAFTSGKASPDDTTFVQKMVPFYADCLIKNSTSDRLSTPQLRLAYSSLVLSASATLVTTDGTAADEYALPWFCIQQLLDAIHRLPVPTSGDVKGKGKGREVDPNATDEQYFKLCLTLISTVSSLPLPLMLRTLDEIKSLILSCPLELDALQGGKEKVGPAPKQREVLLEAIFNEIVEKVGDREKEAALRWWYSNKEEMVSPGHSVDDLAAAGWMSSIKSRLLAFGGRNPGGESSGRESDAAAGSAGQISRL